MADIGAILNGIIGLLDTTVEIAIGLVEEIRWASYRLGIEPIVSVLYDMVSFEISPAPRSGGKGVWMRRSEITSEFKSRTINRSAHLSHAPFAFLPLAYILIRVVEAPVLCLFPFIVRGWDVFAIPFPLLARLRCVARIRGGGWKSIARRS